MATAAQIPARRKEAVPTIGPLEAGDYVCSACGQIMKRSIVMGPRCVEEVKYQCKNEERGCNYEIVRKVPAQNYTGPKGIKA